MTYHQHLGALQAAVQSLCLVARGADAHAAELPPAPEDPVAEQTFAACLENLQALCSTSPGMRQLFAAALESSRWPPAKEAPDGVA